MTYSKKFLLYNDIYEFEMPEADINFSDGLLQIVDGIPFKVDISVAKGEGDEWEIENVFYNGANVTDAMKADKDAWADIEAAAENFMDDITSERSAAAQKNRW